jgi:beta-N-acetylhexosaminidase
VRGLWSVRRLAAAGAVGIGLVAVAGAMPGSASPPTPERVVEAREVAKDTADDPADMFKRLQRVLPVARPAEPVRLPVPEAVAATVANPRTSWGPSLATMEAARQAVAAMPLDRLSGQVIVTRYAGTDPTVPAALVANWHLAGVIMMGDNIESPDQVRATTSAVHAAARSDGRAWFAVIAVDQEGGRVSRLSGVLAELPAFATFGAADDDAATRARFTQLGADMAGLGFTMDLAPVADVTIGAGDPTIGDRSASLDPQVAARTVRAAAGGLMAGGTIPVVKHFPGHGSVTADSHTSLPLQPATTSQLASRDLVPFSAAVDAGVPAVMVAHLDVAALDPGVPSSLSAAAYQLLREDLGFGGVAMTDALDMGAVPEGAPGEAAVRALSAGADLLLMPRDTGAAVTAIVAAVQDGRVPLARLREAATRVVALQMWSEQLRG